MGIPAVQSVFERCLGINEETYIGSGSTIPWNINPDYSNADAREFITANLSEKHDFVWTWQFSRRAVDPSKILIRDLYENTKEYPPTTESSEVDLSSKVDRLKRQLTNITADAPVIRFQEFSKSFYNHTMGRAEAFKVFTVSLQDVQDMNLAEAMRASGFTRDQKNDSREDVTIFVWLYIPSREGDVIPATWGNVIKYASSWLSAGIDNNPTTNDCKNRPAAK